MSEKTLFAFKFRLLPMIQKLKDLGIYESSTILILSDHGNGVQRDRPLIDPITLKKLDFETHDFIKYLPIFLFKAAGDKGPFRIDRRPIGLKDTKDFVMMIWGFIQNIKR